MKRFLPSVVFSKRNLSPGRKSEIRISKSETNSNIKTQNTKPKFKFKNDIKIPKTDLFFVFSGKNLFSETNPKISRLANRGETNIHYFAGKKNKWSSNSKSYGA